MLDDAGKDIWAGSCGRHDLARGGRPVALCDAASAAQGAPKNAHAPSRTSGTKKQPPAKTPTRAPATDAPATLKSVEPVAETADVVRAYVREAIELEKSGAKVAFTEKTKLVFPEDLTTRLDADPDFAAAFRALTPGRQRAYNLHFSAPQQSKTRAARVEKCVQRILEGKGLNDR